MTFCLMIAVCISFSFISGRSAVAAEQKIGVVDIQKVLATSDAGKKAQQAIQARVKKLQEEFKADKLAFDALQKEYKKKKSAWSEQVRQEKEIELKKKRRDLGIKQDDAKLELNKLSEEKTAPLVEKLKTIVPKVAKEKGFDIILHVNATAFKSERVDVTDEVAKALNKETK